jgi:hypothetical protein
MCVLVNLIQRNYIINTGNDTNVPNITLEDSTETKKQNYRKD